MTTIDIPAVPAPPSAAPARPGSTMNAVFAASAKSEWTKIRSVRSTTWSLLITLAITVGLGALICVARVSRWDRLDFSERVTFDPTGFSLNGIFLAQLAIGVLGVLVMTSEYSTGQIRATLAAVPQRGIVLGSKVAVFAAVTFVVGLAASFGAFFAGQAIFAGKHAGVSITHAGSLRAVLGGATYLTLLGSIGLGLGALLRRTAGAIATLVGLLLILPIIVGFLPSPWNDDISKFLPGPAGFALFHVRHQANTLSPLGGLLVLIAYAVGILVAGYTMLARRDA